MQENRESDAIKVIVAKFSALREESLSLGKRQYAFLTLNISMVGIVGAYALDQRNPRLLFLIPILSVTMGLIAARAGYGRRVIANYIIRVLQPMASEITGESKVLTWEAREESLTSNKTQRFFLLLAFFLYQVRHLSQSAYGKMLLQKHASSGSGLGS